MLRELHPDREVQQYQIAWAGDSWRNYDFTPAPLLPDYSGFAVTVQRKRGRPSSADVCAWLTSEPRSVKQAAADLGISHSAASNLLWRLERDGRAIKVIKPAGYRRHATVLYARAK